MSDMIGVTGEGIFGVKLELFYQFDYYKNLFRILNKTHLKEYFYLFIF